MTNPLNGYVDRLDNAQQCVGYLADWRLPDTVGWSTTNDNSPCYLYPKDGSSKPIGLVLVARVSDKYGECNLSGIGNKGAGDDNPTFAQWGVVLEEPTDELLKKQYHTGRRVITVIQERARMYNRDIVNLVGSAYQADGRHTIELSAPMFEARIESDRCLWDRCRLEREWDLPHNLRQTWLQVMSTHRLKPMAVYDENDNLVLPTKYGQVLPGALVEVHFSLFMHPRHISQDGFMHEGHFSGEIEQIVVWSRGPYASAISAYGNLAIGRPLRVQTIKPVDDLFKACPLEINGWHRSSTHDIHADRGTNYQRYLLCSEESTTDNDDEDESSGYDNRTYARRVPSAIKTKQAHKARMGEAAGVIGGYTLHSTLNFKGKGKTRQNRSKVTEDAVRLGQQYGAAYARAFDFMAALQEQDPQLFLLFVILPSLLSVLLLASNVVQMIAA